MATLGELLFYVATQQQDVQSGTTAQEVSDCWSINSATISAVTRCGGVVCFLGGRVCICVCVGGGGAHVCALVRACASVHAWHAHPGFCPCSHASTAQVVEAPRGRGHAALRGEDHREHLQPGRRLGGQLLQVGEGESEGEGQVKLGGRPFYECLSS